MYTSYSADAYKSHDLSIYMKTSSGDTINLDFSNQKSASMSHQESSSGTKDTLSFSSMQSFQYSIDTNGIDEQDKKEIAEFMKKAQPYIDNFLQELDQDAPQTPVNKVAKDITSMLKDFTSKDDNTKNYIKSNLVDMVDNSIKQFPDMEKIFQDAQALLEKTLKEMDNFTKSLYA